MLGIELILPYYHMVSDEELPHISGIYKFRTVQQFKADLEFFLRFYTPVDLQEIICHLEGNRILPKRCFLLTFDDGFREMYDVVAPILYERGVPAVFFLVTSTIDNNELCYIQKKSLLIHALRSKEDSIAEQEILKLLARVGVKGLDILSCIRSVKYRQRHLLDRLGWALGIDFNDYVASVQPYLTTMQISELIKKGFAIGAHSVDHPLYSELTLEEQLFQTRESLNWLSNRFQYKCQSFAFPYSDEGVTIEFFQRAFADGHLKISFGTHGMFRNFFPRNLSRYPMDDNERKAMQILKREFFVTLIRSPS
ncbi:MAG: polysaccharide deacetylase family protein [Candidatus Jordarchaeaceae archaeon]